MVGTPKNPPSKHKTFGISDSLLDAVKEGLKIKKTLKKHILDQVEKKEKELKLVRVIH